MKSDLSRRNFIRKAATGIGFLCIGGSLIAKDAYIDNRNNLSINKDYYCFLQKKAKDLYYRREFDNSLKAYKQLINLDPLNISYYDGIKKVLIQLNHHESAIDYYKTGLSLNPKNPDFSLRLAKFYREIYSGNSKLKEKIQAKVGINILNEAINILKTSIERNSRRIDLYFELIECYQVEYRFSVVKYGTRKIPYKEFAKILLEDSANNYDLVKPYVKEWLSLHSMPKKRIIYDLSSIENIENIDRIKLLLREDKKRRPLYFQEETQQRSKELEKMERRRVSEFINYASSNISLDKLLPFTTNLVCSSDLNKKAIAIVRKRLIRTEDYASLIEINKKWSDITQSIWSLTALAKSYRNNQEYDQALCIYNNIKEKSIYNKRQLCMVYGGLAETYICMNKPENARSEIFNAFDISKEYAGGSLSYIFTYANAYTLEHKYEDAIDLLNKVIESKTYGYIDKKSMSYLALSQEKNAMMSFYEREKIFNKMEEIRLKSGVEFI